jgi:hypothetical protein
MAWWGGQQSFAPPNPLRAEMCTEKRQSGLSRIERPLRLPRQQPVHQVAAGSSPESRCGEHTQSFRSICIREFRG